MSTEPIGIFGLIPAEREPEGVRPATVVYANGRILEIAAPDWSGGRRLDFDGCLILPGLIDLQVNGAGGRDVMEATPEALETIACMAAQLGTTAFLPTVTTNTQQAITEALRVIADQMGRANPGAAILGSHLEGPYFNPNHRGVHPLAQVRPPDGVEFKKFLEAAAGSLRLLTLAPEQPGAEDVIRLAHEAGVLVSVGHSAAEGETLAKARAAGLHYATHLFNAMPPLHHRRPGTVGAVLADPEIPPAIIADGAHLEPTIVTLVARLVGPERLLLVSDAMSAMGLPDGEYTVVGSPATVIDGVPRRPDGMLAGAARPLLLGLRHLIEWTGWPLATALQTATLNPARALGLADQRGRLAPGYMADLIVCDSGTWEVQLTLVNGEVVFER